MTLWPMSSLCCLLKHQFYEKKARKGEDEAQDSEAGGGDVALLV